MGKVKVSVINERKMLDYHKDCCMAMETYYAEYQNQVKRRASTSYLLVFLLLIDSMSSTKK